MNLYHPGSKKIIFPTNCACCNKQPGTERWTVWSRKSSPSIDGPAPYFDPKKTIRTTDTRSVEVPICPACLAEHRLSAQQDQTASKKEDKKILTR